MVYCCFSFQESRILGCVHNNPFSFENAYTVDTLTLKNACLDTIENKGIVDSCGRPKKVFKLDAAAS